MMLGFMRPLYQDFGGWASVYLDTDRRAANPDDALRLRWRDAREQLAGAGADAVTLTALDSALAGPELAGSELAAPGRVLFARDGQVAFTWPLRMPPGQPRSSFGPLPDVMPFLSHYLPPVPRVQVSVNRDGGAVLGVDAAAAAVAPEQPSSAGPTERAGGIEPVHKAHTGGLARPRREAGIERNWADNARDLAVRVQQTASKVGAEYLLLAGDVKARGLLLGQLRPPLADNVVLIESEVAADSPELAAAAAAAVSERVVRQDTERFGEWHRLRAHGLGADGLAEVVAALGDGLAAEVFLHRQARQEAPLWTGPQPTDIGVSAADLRDRGVADPVPARAEDALVRASYGTDAELRFLPAATAQSMPADHICATLR